MAMAVDVAVDVAVYYICAGIFDTKSPVLCNPDMRILRYLQDNYDFMETNSLKHYQTSEYWLVVRGILAQLDGLLAGFKEGQKGGPGAAEDSSSSARRSLHEKDEKKSKDKNTNTDNDKEEDERDASLAALELTSMDTPSLMHFLILNGNGDMFTLIEKFAQIDTLKNITFLGVDCSRERRRTTVSTASVADETTDFIYEYGTSVLDRKRAKLTGKGQDGYRTDHCSALVKVLPDGSDVVFGHNTWDDYRNMGPRVFKHYIYPKWPLPAVTSEEQCGRKEKKCFEKCTARQTSSPPHTYFSSSPGWVTSVDDFYTTFTSPMPLAEEDTGGCVCACDEKEVNEDENEVNLLESSDSVEAAVREHLLDSKRSLSKRGEDDQDDDEEDDEEGHQDGDDEGGSSAGKSNHKSGGGISGGRLAVIETSLEIYEPKLYDLVVPTTLLSWVRVRTANTLAQSGADWATRFSFDHSGTYPNQWIIIDFEKFTKTDDGDGNDNVDHKKKKEGKAEDKGGEDLQPGFLTILEEMPGMMTSRDQTEHLKKKTYWASYNIPFYDDLSQYSKNTQLCHTQQNVYLFQNETLPGVNAATNSKSENDRLGHANCYATCARARLFARLHTDVVDLPSALKIMSHNDFKRDKEAHGNPCEEIACREDLQPLDDDMNVFGAIDTKLSSVVEADTMYRRPSLKKVQDHADDSVSESESESTAVLTEPAVMAAGRDVDHLAPQPLVFPLPQVVPAVVDVSTEGDTGSAVVMQSSSEISEISSNEASSSTSADMKYKQPRIFARQGPTHDGDNKPFCWSDFEKRHDAWVARVKGTVEPGGRRLRAKEMWRKRKPAFRYESLIGQNLNESHDRIIHLLHSCISLL